MIYEISGALHLELKTAAGFNVGWDDDNKHYLNDLDFGQYLKAGFDVTDYIQTTHSLTLAQISLSSPNYKLYRYTDHLDPIKQLDFSTGLTIDLKKVTDYHKGEPVKATYYASASMNMDGDVTYTDPIVLETYIWNRDAVGFCYLRESKIQWYYEDETIGPDEKIIQHYLTSLEIVEEGKERRHRLINAFQLPIMHFMLNTMPRIIADEVQGETEMQWDTHKEVRIIQIGRAFLALHKSAFNNFGDDSNKQIITDITNATDSWIDNDIAALTGVVGLTIRLYLLDQLDMGTE